MKKYKIWFRSVPGFYAQYDGYIDVYADNEDEAIEKAFRKLRAGAFPDRARSSWKIEKIEVIL